MINLINRYRFRFFMSIYTLLFMATCTKDKNSSFEPYDPYPANGATESCTDITLKWKIENSLEEFVTYDVYFGTDPNPYKTIATNTFDTSYVLKDIKADVRYYWKVVAKPRNGTPISSKVWSFTVIFGEIDFHPDLEYGSVTDIDNNTYKTIQIGTQVWMAENLKTTRFNDGTSIPSVTTSRWSDYGPFYGWYNNDEASFKSIYGALYKGYTVSTGKLCPKGWHVPSLIEWETLVDYLGGVNVAGGKMKEAGTAHWKSPNTGATNESGFTALPAGYHGYASFRYTGTVGFFWSCYGLASSDFYFFNMNYDSEILNEFVQSVNNALSVRCVKDN